MSTDTQEPGRSTRRSRSVPAVYGVVSLVLVAGALTFALSSPPPSTPPLAEVAPAPQDQIEVERVEQSSRFGEGQGGEGDCVPGDPDCEGASAEALPGAERGQQPGEVVETDAHGEFRHCPNRGLTQTLDPQSPPCKREIFVGENGGATWTGVTADTIRVAVPRANPLTYAVEDVGQAFVAHFNRHYELYGRHIELVPVDLPDGDKHDPTVQRAAAADVAGAEVFASLEYPGFGPYQAELASRGVLSFTGGSFQGIVREADVAALDPFVWTTYASFEDVQSAAGSLICDGLAGRPARHGGADVREQERRFGLVVQTPRSDGVLGIPPDLLISRLEACGADHRTYEQPADSSDIPVQLQRMRDDGVTSVVCACRSSSRIGDYMDGADALGYEPEWLLAGARIDHLNLGNRLTPSGNEPQRQLAHMFGLDVHLKRLSQGGGASGGGKRYDEHYWYHAARDEDPELTVQQSGVVYYDLYGQLLTLASGVQWAGPELTPETFGAALKRLEYANLGFGQPPWYQPSVGFGPKDHAFNSDVSLFWWRDPEDTAYQARTDFGETCYVGDGARFTAATVPADADALFFNEEAGCR